MSGGFTVSTEQLRSHSRTVQGVSTDVGTAAEAAQTERAGGLVYGVLFDAIALPFLNMWADSMHRAIASAQQAGATIAHGLATNAEVYETVEHGNTSHINGSGEH